MPGFFCDYANNKILDLYFGAVALTAPVTLYVGLSTAVATKFGIAVEPVGGSYARVALTNNLTNFPAGSGGSKSNGTVVTFPAPTGNWGTVLSYFFSDAGSGGNVIAMIDLVTPKPVLSGGAAPFFAIGALFFSHS